jgi:predicted dehydrogenase
MQQQRSIAIVGAGTMGSLHASVVARAHQLARVALVVDPDSLRGAALAAEAGCAHASSLEEAGSQLDAIDVAIVAAHSAAHCELTCALLERGIHVLVEKPMAVSTAQARRMQEAALASDRLLAVGHVERFNPVAFELPGLVRRPRFIQTHRLSPYDAHRVNEGVIMDLMLHDVDLVQLVDPSPVASVTAEAISTRSPTEDLAACTMRLESGLVCQFNVSRVSQRKVRTFQVTMDDGVLDADLLMRTIQVSRDTTSELVEDGTRRYRQHTVTEIPWVRTGGEPLMLQLEDVLAAIENGTEPRVTAEVGVRAVELCEQAAMAAGVSPARV